MVRIPIGNEKSSRVEVRSVSPDANPYMVMLSVFKTGLEGSIASVKNLRTALQGELPQRHLGDAVRLEIADNCSKSMVQFLLQQFELEEDDLYLVNGPVNLVRLMNVPEQVARPDLKFKGFSPGLPAGAFILIAALRGPLRVRALVRVRCPRTGSPLRWREPR